MKKSFFLIFLGLFANFLSFSFDCNFSSELESKLNYLSPTSSFAQSPYFEDGADIEPLLTFSPLCSPISFNSQLIQKKNINIAVITKISQIYRLFISTPGPPKNS